MDPPNATPPKTSIDTSFDGVDPSMDFVGDVNTNNDIPSQEVLKKVEKLPRIPSNPRNIHHRRLPPPTPYSHLHRRRWLRQPISNPHVPRSHKLSIPIYADPTKKLYDELGMMRTLNLGARPEYQRRGTLMGIGQSVLQSLKQIKGGKLFQGGDYQQVGGEFLFEPVRMSTPITSPADGPVGMHASGGILGNGDKIGESEGYEEKRITWCHRMKNTRDHAEIPEIREVLGFDEMVEGERTKRGGPKH
ncbi:hypothetical protein H4I95_06536 [Botrytis cinerea]